MSAARVPTSRGASWGLLVGVLDAIGVSVVLATLMPAGDVGMAVPAALLAMPWTGLHGLALGALAARLRASPCVRAAALLALALVPVWVIGLGLRLIWLAGPLSAPVALGALAIERVTRPPGPLPRAVVGRPRPA